MTDRPRRIVVGLGTGRCGTHSLDGLLGAQSDTRSFHQPKPCLPWHVDFGWYHDLVDLIDRVDAPVVGLVGWYYLNYTELFERDFDAHFVCLRRDRERTVDSIMRLTTDFDHWSNRSVSESASPEYRDLFPKYDVDDKREALLLYWDEYYEIARRFEATHPTRFRVFPTEHLNDETRVLELLQFAGYGDAAVSTPGIRLGVIDEYRWTGRRRFDETSFRLPPPSPSEA